MKLVQQADVAVLALGESGFEMTGEAASRTELGLPGRQLELLRAIVATGKPVVLIVFSGHPLTLTWEAEHVRAILEAWHPGVQAGPALVRTLYGENNPSGKLSVSFPRSVGQEPLYYNHLSTGRPIGTIDDSRPPQTGEEKFHSRYIDQKTTALFPFGFGLSYTTFSYSPVSLSVTSLRADDLNSGKAKLRASADVRNTGTIEGDEIVQLYISERGTSVARPVRELKGFRKLHLKPGESQNVEFAIGRDELAFWNIDMKDLVEAANVKVWIAGSSDQGEPVEFSIR